MCFTHVSFSHDFWVALSALWDRLTCNPSTYMQSKHTFHFLHFFLKRLPEDLQMNYFFESFLTKYVIFAEKNGSKNCFKNKVPLQCQTTLYSQARRLLERQPHVRAVQTQNSCSSNSWSTVWDFCRKKWTGLNIGVKKVTGLLNCSQKNWMDCWLLKTKASVERKC